MVLSFSSVAEEKKKQRFVLYATLMADTPVQLADGARWMMDKGDTFPIAMFKDQQTKVVLQLAGTTFSLSTVNIKVVEEKDVTPAQMETYRTNVQHYLDARAEKWKTEQGK